ncbi:SAM-dependent methyltransferase [Yinghuangia sp. ASG 101]|uniref:SAM-dependent methyltransferase n=1 Tax=Yinghuangia sp. ASG 101 TaxID=2896848 RepID=UPI001E4F6537|nr:SAM-dependent methyltransferase [Yinghuangia sp. ASG 101]UGQ14962.1 SAM-dependent methyltransferase [Yinghuangia sp. ASG 101]
MSGSAFDRTPEQNALVEGWTPPEIDTSRAHSARMYDYYLGGKTNFPADRAAAERVLAAFPSLRVSARENRAFLMRLVRLLAGQGITQFLDIGTGIPIEGRNTHDAAQAVAPESRVVYVDNDPIVLAHARALLTSGASGATAYIDADVHTPESILDHPTLGTTLDVNRPVAVLMLALLHFLPDDHKPTEILARLTERLPSGSHLGLSHVTGDFDPVSWESIVNTYRESGIPGQVRSRAEFAALVPDGWEIVDPGVEILPHWRPDASTTEFPDPALVSAYALVARKL